MKYIFTIISSGRKGGGGSFFLCLSKFYKITLYGNRFYFPLMTFFQIYLLFLYRRNLLTEHEYKIHGDGKNQR